MSWFADLAGRAENLLNNLDEQTGAALRNHNVVKPKRHDYVYQQETLSPGQRKRPPVRNNSKKVSTSTETRSSLSPTRKPSPTSYQSSLSPTRKPSPTSYQHQLKSPTKDNQDFTSQAPRRRKSPLRKGNNQFSLNNCPKTMVGDVKDSDTDDHFGLKQRRYSLPADLELLSTSDMTYKMQNLEVENAMLKNELNVMNREVSELLDRLRKTEDGKVVVNGISEAETDEVRASCSFANPGENITISIMKGKELNKSQIKCDSTELQFQRLGLEKATQSAQLEQLKSKVHELTTIEVTKHKELNHALEMEVSVLKHRVHDLEETLKQTTEKNTENNAAQLKLENEHRHAQSVISELQANLEKSTAECVRLEKEWETYKLRVKSMLHAKDNEIKQLQQGMNLSEETKALVEQLDRLKEERDVLTEDLERCRSECALNIRHQTEQLEARAAAAERVVAALRDALRDERQAKHRVDAQSAALAKELKTVQLETSETIAGLRAALRDMEGEVNTLRCTASSIRSTDTSALNVADYDVMQEQVDNDKVRHLTETLVQRQNRLDALLRDNNSLRIQLDNLESKYKAEIASKRSQHHSVVHVDDRPRSRHNMPASSFSAFSVRFGVAMKRHPLFRTFIVIYMVCLHLWVMTVLFTSTPDGHATAARVKS